MQLNEVTKTNTYRIGIIGIAGKMGNWLAEYFINSGHEVRGYDIRPQTNYPTENSPKHLARTSDIVVVSVPIGVTEEVIRDVGPYLKEGSLFTDVTSIKRQPVKAMVESSSGGVEVIGTHPMFAPRVKSIKGQKIVLTPARGGYWTPRWRDVFEREGGCVIEATPEKHDRMMAIVQGLTHARNIAYAMALKELSEEWNFNIKETMDFTSPVYRIEQGMTARILSQDPELYRSIQMCNQDSKEALRILTKAMQKLENIVCRGESEAFRREFVECRGIYGELAEELTAETDFLIKQLATYQEERYKKQEKN